MMSGNHIGKNTEPQPIGGKIFLGEYETAENAMKNAEVSITEAKQDSIDEKTDVCFWLWVNNPQGISDFIEEKTISVQPSD